MFLTYREILRHRADGFISPPKKGALHTVITLKNPSPSGGYEKVNLETSDYHANHYITEYDSFRLLLS